MEIEVAARLGAISARALLRCCLKKSVHCCVVLPSRQQAPAADSAFIEFAAAKIESMIDRQPPREWPQKAGA